MDQEEGRIRCYLLEELSEAERDRFEAEYFKDDALFDRVRALEDDLIDEYVTGSLSGDMGRRFEDVYLATREGRRKVEVARALQQAVILANEPETTARTPRQWLRALFSLDALTPRFALGAAVVIALLSGVAVWEWLRQEGATSPGEVGRLALLDTSGLATFGSDQTVTLTSGGTLPLPVGDAVRRLVVTGSTQLEPSVAASLATLRGDVTRSAIESAPETSNSTPAPLGPLLTAVRSTAPTLRWSRVPDAREYRVVVAGSGDTIVWRASAGLNTEVTMPSTVLRRGEVYFWQVEAVTDSGVTSAPPVGFWIVDEETLQRVEGLERTFQSSALVLAAAYSENGLYDEALAQVERLAALNPGSAQVRAMRTHLHRQLGR